MLISFFTIQVIHVITGVRFNTIHVDDVAAACWTAAEWMAITGRAEANKIAGENIYFANEKSKIASVQGVPDPKAELIAPLFNLVRYLIFLLIDF